MSALSRNDDALVESGGSDGFGGAVVLHGSSYTERTGSKDQTELECCSRKGFRFPPVVDSHKGPWEK